MTMHGRLASFVRLALIITLCGTSSVPSYGDDAIRPLKTIPTCASIPQGKAPTGQSLFLPCLDGKSTINFYAIKGPAIINVWGSWCFPCVAEIPILREFADSSEVHVIGIDVEEKNKAAGISFVKKNAMNWPILFDNDGRTKKVFGMGVPVTWFIDVQGKVVYKKIGVLKSEDELKSLVKKYLKVSN